MRRSRAPGQGSPAAAAADYRRSGDTPSTYLTHGRGALARQRAAQELGEKLCHIRAVRQGLSRGAGSVLSRRESPGAEVSPAAGRPARPGAGGCRQPSRAGASSPAALPPPPGARAASARGRVRLSSLPRRGSGALPSALAFPAECHCHQSKGKGPAEGVTGGPTRRRTGVARGQGHRMAERRGAGTGGPAPDTAAPATALGCSRGLTLRGKAGGERRGASAYGAGRGAPLPQFPLSAPEEVEKAVSGRG